MMCAYRLERSDVLDTKAKEVRQQSASDLGELLGGPRVLTFGSNPKVLKDWLASLEKGQHTYELSNKETVYVAFDAAVATVSDFIGYHLVGYPQLTWSELEELLIKEYTIEGTAIEAMRSLMKLMQL